MRLPALFTLLAISLPLTATADRKTDAKAHVDKAMAAHTEGRYVDARSELKAAYQLDPQPQLLYALGQVYVKLGQCDEAIIFYERFLESKPAADAADAAAQAINICKGASAQQAAEQDAEQVAATDSPPNESEPPTTTEPTTSSLPLAEPVLEDLDNTETPLDVGRKPPAAPAPPDGPRSFFEDPISLALVGGGVVSAGAGVVLYLSARATLDDAQSARSYDDAARLDEEARGKRLMSIVFTVGGAGLIGGGLAYHLFTNRDLERRNVAVVPTRHGALVSWSGRF